LFDKGDEESDNILLVPLGCIAFKSAEIYNLR